jgi:hypothetical protein
MCLTESSLQTWRDANPNNNDIPNAATWVCCEQKQTRHQREVIGIKEHVHDRHPCILYHTTTQSDPHGSVRNSTAVLA